MATLQRTRTKLQRGVLWTIVGTVLGVTPALAEFPDHSITLIVPWNAGGSTDQTARPLAKAAEQILGQPVVIVNKPGASTTVGMTELARSKPDGYTIATLSSSTYMAPLTGIRVQYDPIKSFTFISYYGDNLIGVVVQKSAKWKTLKELINDGKARPGTITYGAPGVSSTQNLMTKAMQAESGAKFVFVPYTGSSQTVPALLGGHVDFITEVSVWAPYLANDQVRVLAVNTPTRVSSLPDVPTLKELGYPYLRSVQGIVGPVGIPADRAKKLEHAFRAAMKSEAFLTTMQRLRMVITDMSGSETKQVIEDEIAKAKKFLAK